MLGYSHYFQELQASEINALEREVSAFVFACPFSSEDSVHARAQKKKKREEEEDKRNPKTHISCFFFFSLLCLFSQPMPLTQVH